MKCLKVWSDKISLLIHFRNMQDVFTCDCKLTSPCSPHAEFNLIEVWQVRSQASPASLRDGVRLISHSGNIDNFTAQQNYSSCIEGALLLEEAFQMQKGYIYYILCVKNVFHTVPWLHHNTISWQALEPPNRLIQSVTVYHVATGLGVFSIGHLDCTTYYYRIQSMG